MSITSNERHIGYYSFGEDQQKSVKIVARREENGRIYIYGDNVCLFMASKHEEDHLMLLYILACHRLYERDDAKMKELQKAQYAIEVERKRNKDQKQQTVTPIKIEPTHQPPTPAVAKRKRQKKQA